jgi:hypothetical protein
MATLLVTQDLGCLFLSLINIKLILKCEIEDGYGYWGLVICTCYFEIGGCFNNIEDFIHKKDC